MTPCWTKSWFVHPVHRSQLHHDKFLLPALPRVSAKVHSMSIQVWSWQPRVHCVCFSCILQKKQMVIVLPQNHFHIFQDHVVIGQHIQMAVFSFHVFAVVRFAAKVHWRVNVENDQLRQIRSLDCDSHFPADHFFCSVDSSNIERECIALGIQLVLNAFVHKRECWSSVTNCHRVNGGSPIRNDYGNNLQTAATRVCCQNCVGFVKCLSITILFFFLHFRFFVVQKSIVKLTATIFAGSSIGLALTNPMTSAQTRKAQIAFFSRFHGVQLASLSWTSRTARFCALHLSEGIVFLLGILHRLWRQSLCFSSYLFWKSF